MTSNKEKLCVKGSDNCIFYKVVNDLPELICRFDRDCKIIYANDEYCKYFNVPREQLVGKSFLDFIPEDEHDYIKKQIASITPNNPINKYTHFVIKPDGQIAWQRWIDKGFFDDKGNLMEIQSIGEDITELVEIHEKLERGKLFTEKLVSNIPMPTFVIDKQHKVQYWNKACERITGIDEDSAKGTEIHRSFFALEGEDTLADLVIEGSLLKSLNHQKHKKIRVVPEGLFFGDWTIGWENKKKYYNFYATPVYDQNNRLIAVIQTIDDLTEIRKTEKRLEKEMLMAKEAQQNVLPPELDNQKVIVKYIFHPSYHVSGDLIDYLWNESESKLYGVVIDVMGHGLYTAFQGLAVRLLFREIIAEDIPLSKKVSLINKKVADNFIDNSFAAAIFFEIDFEKNIIKYVSAGINSFLVKTKNYTGKIFVEGIFLGILKDEVFQEYTIPFEQGDCFYFASDGLLENLPDSLEKYMDDYDSTIEMFKLFINTTDIRDDVSALCLKIK